MKSIISTFLLIAVSSIVQAQNLVPFYNEKDLWGFKNDSGEVVVQPIYSFAKDFYLGFAKVVINGKWGYLNSAGKEITSLKYEKLSNGEDDRDEELYERGYTYVKLNNKFGLIDSTGKEITPLKYDQVSYFYAGYGIAVVEINGKFGLVNKLGKEITQIKYDRVRSLSGGFAEVSINGKFGFVSKEGKEIEAKYVYVGGFSGGLSIVSINKKYGFINTKGKIAIPLKYDNAASFEEGKARVYLDGKWFYIDKNGNEVKQ